MTHQEYLILLWDIFFLKRSENFILRIVQLIFCLLLFFYYLFEAGFEL